MLLAHLFVTRVVDRHDFLDQVISVASFACAETNEASVLVSFQHFVVDLDCFRPEVVWHEFLLCSRDIVDQCEAAEMAVLVEEVGRDRLAFERDLIAGAVHAVELVSVDRWLDQVKGFLTFRDINEWNVIFKRPV